MFTSLQRRLDALIGTAAVVVTIRSPSRLKNPPVAGRIVLLPVAVLLLFLFTTVIVLLVHIPVAPGLFFWLPALLIHMILR